MAGGQTTAEETERPRAGGAAGAGPATIRRRRRAVALAAVTALVAALTWLLDGSPWLRVTTVEVTGADARAAARVRAAADVPLGEPLASVDTGAVARRVRARLPRVGSVDVSRSWPHTVTIRVIERTPSVVIPRGDGGFTEVDDAGVRYATVATAPRGVPMLRLAPQPAAVSSTRYFGTDRLLLAGVAVAESLPPALRAQALVVTVGGYDAITVELTGGRTVAWGSPEDGVRKAAALSALFEAAHGARHFDVSAPSAPAASDG